MNKLIVATSFIALFATPALAVPRCDIPRGGEILFSTEHIMTETERATFYDNQLSKRGYNVSSVAIWNGCVQAVVHEDGYSTMLYFDPWTLAEIPLD